MTAGRGEERGAVPRFVTEGDTAERFRYELDELLAISRAISSERDIRSLLDLILAKSRQITGADAGSVYVLEDELERQMDTSAMPTKRLRFMLSQNDSIQIDFKEFTLAVDEKSIVGKAVLDARPINIPDLEALSQPGQNPWGFKHNRSFDEKTGYRARSMLTVPMLSARDEVIGVIQLINKKKRPERTLAEPDDFSTDVVPFDERAQQMAFALASQAGICLENAILYDEIKNLFEGFVDASVTAIEARDPTTSGHSRRVATLSVGLAEAVDGLSSGPFADVHYSREDLRQLEYAGVLHDFGKVGVREHVLTKAKKLYDFELSVVQMRFRYIRKWIEAEGLRRQLELAGNTSPAAVKEKQALDVDMLARMAALEECLRFIVVANEPTVMDQPAIARLADIAQLEYVDVDGSRRPYLEPGELDALRISRGSLTSKEREEIQNHVIHTISFLETIPWGRSLRHIPKIAGGHHEYLDGKGYPHGLRADNICLETRMLTISDIFDALTASDRPYKMAVPVPRALGIIESDVKAGKCDPRLFEIFVQAEVYKKVL